MANINISNLQPTEIEFSELSDLELEAVVGGKGGFVGKVVNEIKKIDIKIPPIPPTNPNPWRRYWFRR